MSTFFTSAGSDISVVIPTYNRAPLIVRAVKSALAATRSGDEIIVVDDGSTDDTLKVLEQFGDAIRVVQGQHAGAGAARNLGVSLAKHEWVAFLDSDDEWDADKHALQRPLLGRYPDVNYVFSDFRVTMPDGRIYNKYLVEWSKDPRSWHEILGSEVAYSELAELPRGRADFQVYRGNLYRQLLFRPYLAAFTYIFRKDPTKELPQFATDVATLEDWQFFAQVAKQGNGLYMDCETATQHGHLGRRLTDARELDAINSRLRVIERVWGADEEFQRANAREYGEVVRRIEQRRDFLVGRELALAGRVGEARTAISGAGDIPWKYRLLFRLPNSAVRAVLMVMSMVGVA